MPLKPVKAGSNMYQGWVTHTHSHLGGECPHKCSYCYVRAMAEKFDTMKQRYGGEVRLLEDEFAVKYGSGKTIFIEHMADLFADKVPVRPILRVLEHCREHPDNTYVFQTKNPWRYFDFVPHEFPPRIILGTTIESNRWIPAVMNDSPSPLKRFNAMVQLRRETTGIPLFVTVEPILDFDPGPLADMIAKIRPEFLNIGADSKRRGLPEPTKTTIESFIVALRERNIEIREKHNLGRLLSN